MTGSPPYAWLDGLLETVWLVEEETCTIVYANGLAVRLAGAVPPQR